jgi:hypothetical protein
MCGATASCRNELTLAANTTEAAPTGTSAAAATAVLGASAAATTSAPKAAAAPASRAGRTRERVPFAIAPAIAPRPIAVVSAA